MAGKRQEVVRSKTDELLDRFQAAIGERDRAALRAACAPDLHYEDPLCGEPLNGPDELADHIALLWHGFPDARVEKIGERLTDGQYVAAPVKLLATHREEVAGIPASGRFVVLHAVLYCELDPPRAQLWRVRAFFDLYDAAVQLGVLPRRGGLGERALFALRGFGVRAGRVTR